MKEAPWQLRPYIFILIIPKSLSLKSVAAQRKYKTLLKLPEMQTKRQLIAAILPKVSDGDDDSGKAEKLELK